jgi:threonine/homoserine/homoserine lactone efflux protein
MSLLFFLAQVLVISCSGAMQPGPVTATAIAMGARSRYAGTLLAIGHGIIEFPLMVVIILGMGKYFQLPKVRIAIGLAGGAFLILMAMQSLLSLKAKAEAKPKALASKPVLAGIILSASNPYFLLWWATVGLALATQATKWGIWAFALFALAHWSVDLVWLQILSWASFKGSSLFGPRVQQIVLLICSLALFAFGVFFIYTAANSLIGTVTT